MPTLLEYLDRKMGLKTLFLFSPTIIFLIHDAEEVLIVERFWRENRTWLSLPATIKDRADVTTPQMTAAVAIIFLLGCFASYPAARSPRPEKRVDFSVRCMSTFPKTRIAARGRGSGA